MERRKKLAQERKLLMAGNEPNRKPNEMIHIK